MFVVSPAAILYDQAGNPVAVSPDVAIPAGTSTILVSGTDGTNARIFSVDATGKLAIQNPSNLDTPLSTRLSTSAFTARVNTLGQKDMANSTPMVLASDQSAIPVTDNGGTITVDGTVTADQGTAAALTGAWPVQVTDGTNTLPTGDANARAIFTQLSDGTNGPAAVKPASTPALTTDKSLVTAFSPNSPLPSGTNEVGFVAQGTAAALADYWPVGVTDGTNVQPTGDVAARAIYGYVTDGTNTTAVKAASTAALAADPSLVTAFSPNSPLPSGTNEVGFVAQGTAAALADYWPVGVTDGTNMLPTADVAARALYAKVTDGTNTQPTGDVAARSIFTQISDATNGPVAVKAASTAALAADPSLVTAFSPNSPLPVGTNEVGAVAQGTPAALADYWPVRHTDGTNTLPTMDVAARSGYVRVTDGTNTQPTGDLAARSIFTQISDATNGPVAVKAASTAALAADPSLVTAFSPNSPLPVGTNQIGKIEQGTAAALAGRWPVEVTDGTNTMPTMDVAARSGYVRVTDGTNTQPTGDVAARSVFTQISDGTNGPVAVVPGSASPTVNDKALVVQVSPNQDPIPTTVVPATSIAGSATGRVSGLSANTFTTVRQTTYVEQTTDGQRSIVSTSANDSAAGTGARQVRIVYLDATGAGPFTETVTLNGTTAVNTVATDICFIERMDVVAVGSNASNVGTLNLYTGTGATGTIFAAIGTGAIATGRGDNQTLYAHHYVPVNYTVTGYYVSCGIIAAAGGGSSVTIIQFRDPTVATSPWLLASDIINAAQGNSTARTYYASIKIPGPLVLAAWVTPGNNNSTATCSFDYADAPV